MSEKRFQVDLDFVFDIMIRVGIVSILWICVIYLFRVMIYLIFGV